MAHEVKNPLIPIKLTTQRLLRRSREGRLDPKSVEEGAETILAEVASLVHLVDSFSQFAKLPQPQPQKTDALKLVQQTMTMFVPIHTRITWQIVCPSYPIEIFWDQDMIKRALINMVNNAVSALESQAGDLSTNFGCIRVSLYLNQQLVCIEVDDNSPGVPELDRSYLFNPYFSTKQKGTGLGLAIVHRIADDHGGETYYQPLEPGSRFGIKLPLQSDGV
jgi:two-component system nitrogen regulation sensor histidine kinase NtrY